MFKVIEKAPAKINLFLEVTKKRTDGYHDIETIMRTVSLSDTVTVEKSKTEGTFFECFFEDAELFTPTSLPDEKDNLAYKAAELFMSQYAPKRRSGAEKGGVKITVQKRIPVCAGLAGGSSDAAAVLRALNLLYDNPFGQEELRCMGALLGSDVPFCVEGGLCLCRGRGEILTPLVTKTKLQGIIAIERGRKKSTKDAYQKIDNLPERKIRSAAEMAYALEKGDCNSIANKLYNVFESACDYGSRVSAVMKENGAIGVLMSGSGPAFFGLFDDEKQKNAAKAALETEKFVVYNL